MRAKFHCWKRVINSRRAGDNNRFVAEGTAFKADEKSFWGIAILSLSPAQYEPGKDSMKARAEMLLDVALKNR